MYHIPWFSYLSCDIRKLGEEACSAELYTKELSSYRRRKLRYVWGEVHDTTLESSSRLDKTVANWTRPCSGLRMLLMGEVCRDVYVSMNEWMDEEDVGL